MNQVHAPDMQDLLRQLSLDFANQLPHKLQEIAGLLQQHRVKRLRPGSVQAVSAGA